MLFKETEIEGVHIVEQERIADERGFFARVWCEREFREHGLTPCTRQGSVGFTTTAGTIRGMHFQRSPYEEVKLVRCSAGAVFDVAVDLRPGSATYLGWIGVELTRENGRALYVPEGCAHGYQTLRDGAEVVYQMSHEYVPSASCGVRYDDPAVGVSWPLEPTVIADKDKAWPLLDASPGHAQAIGGRP